MVTDISLPFWNELKKSKTAALIQCLTFPSFSGDWVWSTAPQSSLRDKVLRSGNQSAPGIQKAGTYTEMHSLGHGGDSKKMIRPFIYHPKHASLCQTSSSQFENCWPEWHALDLKQHTTVKGWEHGAASSMENALLKEATDHLENNFVTKVTVPLFCLHYKQAHKMACVSQTFPKQSALLQHTCVTVCTADSPLTNTGLVRKVFLGVQFDLSISNSFRTWTVSWIFKVFPLIVEEGHKGGNRAQ